MKQQYITGETPQDYSLYCEITKPKCILTCNYASFKQDEQIQILYETNTSVAAYSKNTHEIIEIPYGFIKVLPREISAERQRYQIYHQGYLKKEAGVVKWHTRFFILKNCCLQYSYRNKIKRVIKLINPKVTKIDQDNHYDFSLQVKGEQRTWIFRADTELERNKWIEYINQSAIII